MVFLYVDVHLQASKEHESSTWAHFQAEIPTKVGPELFVEGLKGTILGYSSKIERSVPSEWKLRAPGQAQSNERPPCRHVGTFGHACRWGWKVTSLSSNLFHALEWYESLFPGGLVIGALVPTSTHCPTNPSKHSRLVESRLRPERHWKVALVCWEPCFEAREDMVYRSDTCFSTRPWWLSPSQHIHRIHLSYIILWNSFAKSDDWNVNAPKLLTEVQALSYHITQVERKGEYHQIPKNDWTKCPFFAPRTPTMDSSTNLSN